MNTLIAAAEPEPGPRWSGTAWWGFCYHCGCWFNTHTTTCPLIAPVVTSTTTNPVLWWPVSPSPNIVTLFGR